MQQPMVSIILPCYNVSQYLEACVRSIQANDWDDYEIIMVDDGATDNTGEIADALAGSDGRLRVVHRRNGGLSAARNTGIEAATGTYLLFIDPDDTVEVDLLPSVIPAMEQSGADYGIYGFRECHERDGVRGQWQERTPLCSYSYVGNEEIVKDFLPAIFGDSKQDVLDWYRGVPLSRHREWCGVWRFVYRRSVVVDNGIRFDEHKPLYEDMVFNSEYCLYATRMITIEGSYYRYVVRKSGLMSNMGIGRKAVDTKVNMLRARRRIMGELVDLRKMTHDEAIDLGMGSLVLPAFGLIGAIANAGMPFGEGYAVLRDYISHREVREAIARFPLGGGPKIALPVCLLKLHLSAVVYAMLYTLAKHGVGIR